MSETRDELVTTIGRFSPDGYCAASGLYFTLCGGLLFRKKKTSTQNVEPQTPIMSATLWPVVSRAHAV